MNITRSLRHIIVALTPFVLGIVLGFLVMPADGKALERTDYAGISQIGDPECARLARLAGLAFVSTAFKVYDVQAGTSRYCDLSATTPAHSAFSPDVTFGMARSRFARGELDTAR